MDEFILTIDKEKFRSTNAKWNELMLNDPWSVGYVSSLIESANWKSKEEWELTYYKSGENRNKYIEENAIKLGYNLDFFNDTTIPSNKQEYYKLNWDIKNINTQRGRTKDDFIAKGKILYNAVKNNGYNLSLEECIECVRFRVICETWNGIIIRERNTISKMKTLFPSLIFEKTDGEMDHKYAIDFQVFKNSKLVFAIQVKPPSYATNKAPYIMKAKYANEKKYAAYTEKYGVPVFTIISSSKGEIQNLDTIEQIKKII